MHQAAGIVLDCKWSGHAGIAPRLFGTCDGDGGGRVVQSLAECGKLVRTELSQLVVSLGYIFGVRIRYSVAYGDGRREAGGTTHTSVRYSVRLLIFGELCNRGLSVVSI